MIYVDFCKSPKGFWVGCGEYQNGRAYASGRTIDILVKHIKTVVYRTWGISARNVILSSRQMEQGEFQAKHMAYMGNKFKGKFWNEPKPTKLKVITEPVIEREEPKEKEEVKEKKKESTKFIYEEKNGVLYVYEKKLVGQYQLETE
jgi:hypothetical protein